MQICHFPFTVIFSPFFRQFFDLNIATWFTLFVVPYSFLYENINTLFRWNKECRYYYFRRYFYLIESCRSFIFLFFYCLTYLHQNLIVSFALFVLPFRCLFKIQTLHSGCNYYFRRHFYLIQSPSLIFSNIFFFFLKFKYSHFISLFLSFICVY